MFRSIMLVSLVVTLILPVSAQRVPSTPLQRAASAGNLEAVREALKSGALEATNNEGRTALMLAASNGKTEVTKLLVESGASLQARDKSQSTALHLAAQNNHYQTLHYLLQQSAEIDVVDQDGNTPLHLAATQGHEQVVAILLEEGANFELLNGRGEAAAHLPSRFKLGDWRLTESHLKKAEENR